MSLYIDSYVDQDTKQVVLQAILECRSFDVLTGLLDRVTSAIMLNVYSQSEVKSWLSDHSTLNNNQNNTTLTDRFVRSFFWRRLYAEGKFDEVMQRTIDGSNPITPQVYRNILGKLSQLSFDVAINTWLATCEHWLQVCNVDVFLAESKKDGWSNIEDRVLAKHMAGYMELMYM
jgi:hypothetical protein